MELRVLRYFLAVAREENLSEAAKRLHITQPTLSRQMMELEEELGVKLFVRGRRSRKITLTEAGMYLRTHAEEVVMLTEKIQSAFAISGEKVTGDVYVGIGETNSTRLLAQAAQSLREEGHQIYYHFLSGNGSEAEEKLDKGLVDFALLLEPINPDKYEYFIMPLQEFWGVLMRKDAPLAKQEGIRAEDLWDKPLILSREIVVGKKFFNWLKRETGELNVVAYCNHAYNSTFMTEGGLGYTFSLYRENLVSQNSELCFRPLEPRLEYDVHFVWKKNQVLSKAAKLFLNRIREMIREDAH